MGAVPGLIPSCNRPDMVPVVTEVSDYVQADFVKKKLSLRIGTYRIEMTVFFLSQPSWWDLHIAFSHCGIGKKPGQLPPMVCCFPPAAVTFPADNGKDLPGGIVFSSYSALLKSVFIQRQQIVPDDDDVKNANSGKGNSNRGFREQPADAVHISTAEEAAENA